MKKILLLATVLSTVLLFGCASSEKKTEEQTQESTSESSESSDETKPVQKAEDYDPKRGEGKYTAESLALTDKIDAQLSKTGNSVSDVKCASCHKYSDERLVGPGWKGITD